MKDPMNLELVNLKSLNRKKVKEKTQSVNQALSEIHVKINHRNKLVNFGYGQCSFRISSEKTELNMRVTRSHGGKDVYRPILQK